MDQRTFHIPTSVKIASGIWVTYGILLGIGVLMMFFMIGSASQENVTTILITASLLSMFTAFFLYFGYATFKGKAKDVLGNGIGVVVYGAALMYSNMDFLNILTGLILIASGVLALIYRREYLSIKQS